MESRGQRLGNVFARAVLRTPLLHRVVSNRLLIITTIGRRTGKQHTWPLVGVRDGERWIVIASNGGQDVHPSWYLNLTAHPDATLEAGGERWAVRADAAKGAERERIWQLVVAEQPVFRGYQDKTDREIPVVVLTRLL